VRRRANALAMEQCTGRNTWAVHVAGGVLAEMIRVLAEIET